MSRTITTVISFKIESSFYEWANKFDSKTEDRRHYEFDIKPLFRSFSNDDPQKLICIQKALKGNIHKIFQSISESIKSNKVYFLTMEEFSWI